MASEQSTPRIRVGIQPTCWTNDDFPEIGDDTPYQTILDETRECGYEGGSTGHNYPTHLPSLLRAIAFLHSVGAKDLVVAELAGAVNQVRTKDVLNERPIFNEAQFYLLQKGLNDAGQLAHDAGMRLSYHHHVGTGVQNREEIDRLFEGTNKALVWMCIDTAHALYAGVDPIALAKKYAQRIGHVHLKNLRMSVRKRAVDLKYSFFQAIHEGIFTVPGDPEGAIDFAPVFAVLKRENYSGWLIVEAEQDPAKANPKEHAAMARAYIQQGLGI
jgi:inosose dehydratase